MTAPRVGYPDYQDPASFPVGDNRGAAVTFSRAAYQFQTKTFADDQAPGIIVASIFPTAAAMFSFRALALDGFTTAQLTTVCNSLPITNYAVPLLNFGGGVAVDYFNLDGATRSASLAVYNYSRVSFESVYAPRRPLFGAPDSAVAPGDTATLGPYPEAGYYDQCAGVLTSDVAAHLDAVFTPVEYLPGTPPFTATVTVATLVAAGSVAFLIDLPAPGLHFEVTNDDALADANPTVAGRLRRFV